MRVSLDARTMQTLPLGGIGRSLANVIPHLTEVVDLQLLTDAGAPRLTGGQEHALNNPWPHRGPGWLQWSVPRHLARNGGILHCPFYALPYRQPVPMVVSLHDLSFEHRREWFGRTSGALFRLQARFAARTAAVVLTGSAHVRDDIVATYGIDPGRILVTSQAVDPSFTPGLDPGSILHRLGVTAPYVVALGGAPRRGLPRAVEAWRRTPGAGPLVVVGGEVPSAHEGLFYAGRVADADWAALLSGARAFLYATEYEGFGMPGLEAAACGTPVVCARVGSLPEVLGDAASWALTDDADGLAAALAAVVHDEELADRLQGAGRSRARALPGWADVAAVHLEAYRRASA